MIDDNTYAAGFQQFLSQFSMMTCVISVESYPDGSYGNIRIITGNAAYIASTEYYIKLGDSVAVFRPNVPYEYYLQKDLNFEDYCYRCAVKKQPLHSYIKPERYPFWIHNVMLPIEPPADTEYPPDTSYCIYTQELTEQADASLMASLSPEIANAVLRTCIKLNQSADFHQTMDDVIHYVRDLCDAHHCCIFLTDFSAHKCSVLCESLREGTNLLSMKSYVNDDFVEIAATWERTIAGSTCLIVQDEKDRAELKKRNPVWFESMYSAGGRTIVLFPLKSGSETIGYIWAINFDTDHTAKIKDTLELTAYFIAATISNHLLFERLETLSSMDLLTGVFNRNAMNNRVDKICRGEVGDAKTVGIIFADLNGLKRVNDENGHLAGDLLLKNAALVLQNHFMGCEVYRAGGDEFMVVAVNMPEEEVLRRVRRLADDHTGDVCFAVGYCIEEAAEIRKAMHTADERMYADKKAFYRLHPELKR